MIPPWLSATPQRAAAEGTLPALGAVLLTAWHPLKPADTTALVTLMAVYAFAWCAFRLRVPAGPWSRQVIDDARTGAMLACVLSPIVFLGTTHTPGRLLVVLVAGGCLGWLVRWSIRLWLVWHRVRRRRLRWAITHAHLLVALVAALLLGAVLVGIKAPVWLGSPGSVIALLTVLTWAPFAILGLVIVSVLPSSALFSWLVAGATTRRIEMLATATAQVRAGHYQLRVPVEGEDEVAHLQEDFNAMAAELEQTVGALRSERDRVAGLLAARRELIVGVSHELRTPLATLRSYLELIEYEWRVTPPEDALRRNVGVMGQEIMRLQTLIDDLFVLARLDLDRLAMQPASVDVCEVARRCVAAVAPLAWQSGRVKVVSTNDTGAMALVDMSRLEQVIHNLLHNAVRHTPPGGIVALTIERAPTTILLHVADTGEGITAAHLPYIWDRFYRGENTGVQGTGGTGLGLAIVKELTEAMHGTVSVASVEGEGSTFTISLPRC